jgi:hypothetical protein
MFLTSSGMQIIFDVILTKHGLSMYVLIIYNISKGFNGFMIMFPL